MTIKFIGPNQSAFERYYGRNVTQKRCVTDYEGEYSKRWEFEMFIDAQYIMR